MLNHDGTDAEVWNAPTHAPVPHPGRRPGRRADHRRHGRRRASRRSAWRARVTTRCSTATAACAGRASSATAARTPPGRTVFDFDGDGSVEIDLPRRAVPARLPRLRRRAARQDADRRRAPGPSSRSSPTWTTTATPTSSSSATPSSAATSQTGLHVLQDVANQWATHAADLEPAQLPRHERRTRTGRSRWSRRRTGSSPG